MSIVTDKKAIKKVVLAYSGGLDTSVIIPWLKENYGCEVIAVCCNLGQPEDYAAVEKKAIKSGASKAYILDVQEEFVADYIWPTVKAGAVYEGKYLLGTSFARPLIAKKLVEVAKAEGADAIAHGATGKGNDQVRFELTVKALAPELKIIAPWREWDIRSREDAIAYAEKHNIPVAKGNKVYSMDRNIWHLSHEGSDLEDPWNAPKDSVYLVTKSPEAAPDVATYVEVEFEKGTPVAVDGVKMGAVELMVKLNELGAANGIGITDIVENRLVGMKSRGIYEAPGMALLHIAYERLLTGIHNEDTIEQYHAHGRQLGRLLYQGRWFDSQALMLRDALQRWVASAITGEVTLELRRGNDYSILNTVSDNLTYKAERLTMEKGESVFSPDDRIGQLTMRNLDITDTREKLFNYVENGLLSASSGNGLPQVENLEHSDKK